MDVKAAVQIAKKYLADLYESEQITKVRLSDHASMTNLPVLARVVSAPPCLQRCLRAGRCPHDRDSGLESEMPTPDACCHRLSLR